MKLWEGRFSADTHSDLMDDFNNSLPLDRILIEEDIAVNSAWAATLERAGLLNATQTQRIHTALDEIRKEYQEHGDTILTDDEDIHTAVERLLIDKVGDVGKAIHTGRSRNDQVSCDFRLYTKKACRSLTERITELQKVLYSRARNETDVMCPGYTHLQQAQPIVLAHYWLSLFWALQREKTRIEQAHDAADMLTLGSGALAGSGFLIDRRYCAGLLGFSRISDNSIDAVSSRDFALELLAALCSCAVVLSRYSEDLIIWSSAEFGYIELSDAWSTGSSMMPQKKNPDSLELIRGKTGRFIGYYTRLATTLKGIGLSYYKDLQEDKEPVFDGVAQMQRMLQVMASVVESLQVRRNRMRTNCDEYMLATDIADYLVEKHIPFREAHHIAGRIVAHCIEQQCSLFGLSLDTLRTFSDAFDKNITGVLQWPHSLSHRDVAGGTGPTSVQRQLDDAAGILDTDSGQ
jgi:argininosuccinate lyase